MRSHSLTVVSLLSLIFIIPTIGYDGAAEPTVKVTEQIAYAEGMMIVPPGESAWIGITSDSIDTVTGNRPPLPTICQEAVNLSPMWLRIDLIHKFRDLPTQTAEELASLMVNSSDRRFVDEIGFSIAHSTVSSLSDEDFLPEILTHNAELVYERDEDLEYVRILEEKDHTTVEIKTEDGKWNVIPRDIYYWYIVHPRIGDELPTYVDPDYNYATDPPFSRDHGVAPPVGKYWREWLYIHNKSGQPLLKDSLSGSGDVMEAIRSVNGWISGSMEFTSDQERPNQPVRIYQKGIGRCGEYQDMRAAAARIGLIPVICTNNPAEDHVWNEFWMNRWVHWDGSIDRPHMYENGWGKTLSSVWNARGDGLIWSVTGRYSGTCNITVNVSDSGGMPVEGAKVEVLTENFYQEDIKTVTLWGITNQNGSVTLEVGEGRNYWFRVDGGDLGQYPLQIAGPEEVVIGSEEGKEYEIEATLPRSSPELRVSGGIDTDGSGEIADIGFKVDSHITSQSSDFTGGRFDNHQAGGCLDYFLVDERNFNAFRRGLPFSYFEFKERVREVDTLINIGDIENLFLVFSNEYSQWTTKIVRFDIDLAESVFIKVNSPLPNSTHPLGEDLVIRGEAVSSNQFDNVEVSLKGDEWFVATEVNGPGFATWECSIPSDHLEIGDVDVLIRGDDGSHVLTASVPISILDLRAPSIEISSPGNGESFIRGDSVEVIGMASDEDRVFSISLLVDGSEEGYMRLYSQGEKHYRFTMDTGLMDLGSHNMTISSRDPSGNIGNVSVEFHLLEDDPPELVIDSPEDDELISSRTPIEIRGTVSDNTGVASLSLRVDGGRIRDITSSINRSYFNYNWDASDLIDGHHLLTLEASDPAGNSKELDMELLLDGSGPEIDTLDLTQPIIVSEEEAPTIEIEVEDESGISLVEYYLDGEKVGDITRRLSGNMLRADLEGVKDLEHGEHDLMIRAEDILQNPSEVHLDLVVDGVKPSASLTVFPWIFEIGTEFDVSGVIGDDHGIQSAWVEMEGGDRADLEPIDGEFRVVLKTSSVPVGERALSLHCLDLASNSVVVEETILAVTIRTDSDRDGIPDLFEVRYEGMDYLVYDSEMDLDGDGYTNLQEYLGDDRTAGGDDSSDPLDPSSFPKYQDDERSIPVALIIIISSSILLLLTILVIGTILVYRPRS